MEQLQFSVFASGIFSVKVSPSAVLFIPCRLIISLFTNENDCLLVIGHFAKIGFLSPEFIEV